MKAIVCKYIGPSNIKGSRIKAYAEGGNSITISYPHELSGSDVYRVAAEALCRKMKWEGQLIEGGLPNQDYVFVFLPKAYAKAAVLLSKVLRGQTAHRWRCNSDESDLFAEIRETVEDLSSFTIAYRCATCGKTGPEHGHYDATDPTTHKFVCGEPIHGV